MKILIVEDDTITLNSLEFILKKEHHEVSVSSNGMEALLKMEQNLPDLIITDVMMPYISGLELIKIVTKNYPNQIPIIVISSLGNEDIVLEAFSLGANDYLTKPININELNSSINRFSPKIAG